MKTLILSVLLALACLSSRAESIWTEAWNNLTDNTGSLVGDTNWVNIPYMAHDLGTHRVGWGNAVLHRAGNNVWAGLRYEDLNGYQSTAGVQAQLQVSKQIGWFSYTPFLETTVGIGSSSIYGSTGPGLYVSLYQIDWHWPDGEWSLGLGATADYEHYTFSTSHSGNKIDTGIGVSVQFP